MAVIALLFALSCAWAGEVVLRHGVSADLARARAAVDLGVAPETLRVLTLAELTAGRGPALLGEGTLTTCAGVPVDPDAVVRLVESAETRLLYLDYPGVDAALAAVRAAHPCLRAPLDPAVAARAWFLAGIAAHDRGDLAGADHAFDRAWAYAPGTPWDPDFPPAAQPAYEAAAARAEAAEPVSLRVVPLLPEHTLRVDGRVEAARGGARLADVAVAPGEHLVQVTDGATTLSVRVDVRASATLVMPSLLTDDAARWAVDPGRAPQLDAALSALLPPGDAVTVALPEETWRREPGRGWYRLARHPPALTRRSFTNALVAGGGAALTLGGSALGILGWVQGRNAVELGEQATSWTEYTVQKRNYAHARNRLYVGEGLMALGATAFTVGIAVPLGHAPAREDR